MLMPARSTPVGANWVRTSFGTVEGSTSFAMR